MSRRQLWNWRLFTLNWGPLGRDWGLFGRNWGLVTGDGGWRAYWR